MAIARDDGDDIETTLMAIGTTTMDIGFELGKRWTEVLEMERKDA
jgi:hypothetical protein